VDCCSGAAVQCLDRMVIHDWERKKYKDLIGEVGFTVDRSSMFFLVNMIHNPF
jgi:hypothetical protein